MGIINSLFDTFNETIFLKDTSDLQAQAEELRKLKEECKSKEKEIDRDIKLLELGARGEDNIVFELKNANLGLYVLRDITIEYEDSTAQIDFIVVSKGFIYLIECKNLIGNITVDENGQFRREYELNGKKINEATYSPYRQAERHREILKKKWVAKHSRLAVATMEKNFDTLWYKPLVVIANPKSLLNTRYAPKNIKQNIVRVDNLIEYIKKDISEYKKDYLSSKKHMKEIAEILLDANVKHSCNFADKYKKSLTGEKEKNHVEVSDDVLNNKLRAFRKEKSRANGIPAYYVFTDKELEEILKRKPQTKDNLNGILSPIKIKMHGDEIIKIIKE